MISSIATPPPCSAEKSTSECAQPPSSSSYLLNDIDLDCLEDSTLATHASQSHAPRDFDNSSDIDLGPGPLDITAAQEATEAQYQRLLQNLTRLKHVLKDKSRTGQ